MSRRLYSRAIRVFTQLLISLNIIVVLFALCLPGSRCMCLYIFMLGYRIISVTDLRDETTFSLSSYKSIEINAKKNYEMMLDELCVKCFSKA